MASKKEKGSFHYEEAEAEKKWSEKKMKSGLFGGS